MLSLLITSLLLVLSLLLIGLSLVINVIPGAVALLLLAVNIVVSRMVGTLQAVVVIRYAGELLYSTDPFTRNRKYWPRLDLFEKRCVPRFNLYNRSRLCYYSRYS